MNFFHRGGASKLQSALLRKLGALERGLALRCDQHGVLRHQCPASALDCSQTAAVDAVAVSRIAHARDCGEDRERTAALAGPLLLLRMHPVAARLELAAPAPALPVHRAQAVPTGVLLGLSVAARGLARRPRRLLCGLHGGGIPPPDPSQTGLGGGACISPCRTIGCGGHFFSFPVAIVPTP